MDILMLNETEVQRLLDPDALLDALAGGFRALSEGLVDAPKRIGVTVPNTGFLLAMPAYQQDREIGPMQSSSRPPMPGHVRLRALRRLCAEPTSCACAPMQVSR